MFVHAPKGNPEHIEKQTMKRFTKTAILTAGLSVAAMTTHAAFTANDLYLGFSSPSASSDYIVDLGQPGSVGVGGSSVVDLSTYLSQSLLNSAFATEPAGVSVGVAGGQSQFPSSYSIFATSLRLGGPGNPAVAGSDLSSFSHSANTISSSVSDLSQVALPATGTGVLDAGKSWNTHVLTLSPGSFYGDSGINPNAVMDGSGVIYEDLWGATAGNAYSYLGFFSLNVGGAQPSLSFTPTVVPEPTVGALACVGGLCLFALRQYPRCRPAGNSV